MVYSRLSKYLLLLLIVLLPASSVARSYYYDKSLGAFSRQSKINHESLKYPSGQINTNYTKEPSNDSDKSSISNFIGEGNLSLEDLSLEESYIMKGENAQLSLTIQSKSLTTLHNLSATILLTSLPSDYGLQYFLDKDQDGLEEPLTLQAEIHSFVEVLNPEETIVEEVIIGPTVPSSEEHFGIIPLNRGSWKVSEIILSTADIEDCVYLPLEELVITVTFNPYENVVFAYYLTDDIPPFSSGRTMKDALQLAIDRLENSYSFSIKILVITEDNSWTIGAIEPTVQEFRKNAWIHVGQKLGLKDGTWNHLHGYDLFQDRVWTKTKKENAGYDILIAVTKKSANNHLGFAGINGNWGVVTSGRLDLLNYKISENGFDKIIQHEISHIFGAYDRDYSNTIMDTAPAFYEEGVTSPCVELTNYTNTDLRLITENQGRFNGPVNPVSGWSWDREITLQSSKIYNWSSPVVAQSSNPYFPKLHLLLEREFASEESNTVIYHKQAAPSGVWSEEMAITDPNKNSTNAAITVDLQGNIHVVWIDKTKEEDSYGKLYYRKRDAFGGIWGEKIILENLTNCVQGAIATDSSGIIHLVYEQFNGTASKIYYRQLSNATWFPSQLISNSSINAYDPSVLMDPNDGVHLAWIERNDKQATNGLYYSYWNNTNQFSQKELIHQESVSYELTDPQISLEPNGTTLHFLWQRTSEENEKQQKSLWYTERISNGTVIPATVLSSEKQNANNPSIIINDEGAAYVFWENLDLKNNRRHVLYRVKTSKGGDWSQINRLPQIRYDTFEPALTINSEGDLVFIYCSFEEEIIGTDSSSVIYQQKIYQEFYAISVSNFTFSKINLQNYNRVLGEISNIRAYSNSSAIGALDDYSKASLRRFGIWRIGAGIPCFEGNLELDRQTGQWFARIELTECLPGEYVAIVVFQDSQNTKSDYVVSSTSIIINGENNTINDKSKNNELIIGLATGIPAFLIVVVTSIILIIKNQKRNLEKEKNEKNN
ncbi:MAG: hypothetical protein GF308_04385 [Candidatus Heimdallarchaeota archaeon]|nr:hypothetical protein [Candidatus Heimdallarchaeota archaeon]